MSADILVPELSYLEQPLEMKQSMSDATSCALHVLLCVCLHELGCCAAEAV